MTNTHQQVWTLDDPNHFCARAVPGFASKLAMEKSYHPPEATANVRLTPFNLMGSPLPSMTGSHYLAANNLQQQYYPGRPQVDNSPRP